MHQRLIRPIARHSALAVVAALLCALALHRAPDHDESQYVAAAVLAAHGLLPYRDFAYFQTPLQPLAFAPLALWFGSWAWPGLRLANALLAAVAVAGVYRAARITGAAPRLALASAGLFACSDALLFGAATARNDALPVALLALGLGAALQLASAGSRRAAVVAGLCLAAAAAAKLSYALPALAFGLWTLARPAERRPAWVLLGALPALALVGWAAWLAPAGFRFGVFEFPVRAPLDYYAARPDKLSLAGKTLDVVKFLALGPAFIAFASWRRERTAAARLLDVLIVAGAVAAWLPTPVWRQYLLPLLPPLFVRAALAWQTRLPGRTLRVAAAAFAGAGLAPSLLGPGGFRDAYGQGEQIGAVLDRAHATSPVVTLSPQFLPAAGRVPDLRFAAGPFYFRSRGLLSPAQETKLKLVRSGGIPDLDGWPVLVGGEGPWTAGDARLDAILARAALAQGYSPRPVPGGRFTLFLRARTPS